MTERGPLPGGLSEKPIIKDNPIPSGDVKRPLTPRDIAVENRKRMVDRLGPVNPSKKEKDLTSPASKQHAEAEAKIFRSDLSNGRRRFL